MKKKFAVLIFCLFLFNIATAWAEISEAEQQRVKEKEAELQNLQGEMAGKKRELDAAKQKASEAYSEFSEADATYAVARGELAVVEAELARIETQINDNEKLLEQALVNLKARTDAYNKRIKNIYMHGQVNYLDVILGAKDFSDFTTRFELLLRIIKNDISLIDKIKEEQVIVTKKQEDLKVSLAEQQKLYDEQMEKKKIVEEYRMQKKGVFDSAAGERNRTESEYRELLALSDRIKTMIQRIESGGKLTGKGTGQMDWPIRGTITSYFGWRTHPIFGTQKYHSGMDIAADYNDPIKAADEGVVISAGWIGGYGYTVILDHGGGLTTLYAHNNSLTVSAGQTVAKGQTIALAGSTGYSTGPHCHFEVRKHGELVEPLNYLP